MLTKTKLQKESLSWHDLAVHNAFGLTKKGKIHLRMCTGKLNDNVLKPLIVSFNNIVSKLLLCPSEGFNRPDQGLSFLGQLAFNPPQKDLTLRAPLFHISHLDMIPIT